MLLAPDMFWRLGGGGGLAQQTLSVKFSSHILAKNPYVSDIPWLRNAVTTLHSSVHNGISTWEKLWLQMKQF